MAAPVRRPLLSLLLAAAALLGGLSFVAPARRPARAAEAGYALLAAGALAGVPAEALATGPPDKSPGEIFFGGETGALGAPGRTPYLEEENRVGRKEGIGKGG